MFLNDCKVVLTEEEYEELLKRSLILTALENYGVDNWEGFEAAMESIAEKDD